MSARGFVHLHTHSHYSLLEALPKVSELVAAAHLSFPGLGHIAREGNAYRFVPVDYVNRDVK